MKLNLNAKIEADDVINAILSLSNEDAVELIAQIDDWMVDSSFSEALITRLVTALKGDVSDDVNLPFIDWDKVPSKP